MNNYKVSLNLVIEKGPLTRAIRKNEIVNIRNKQNNEIYIGVVTWIRSDNKTTWAKVTIAREDEKGRHPI